MIELIEQYAKECSKQFDNIIFDAIDNGYKYLIYKRSYGSSANGNSYYCTVKYYPCNDYNDFTDEIVFGNCDVIDLSNLKNTALSLREMQLMRNGKIPKPDWKELFNDRETIK